MMTEIKTTTTKIAWLIFAVGAFLWLVLHAVIPPKSSTSTILIFNGGGANWAMGLGFVNATTPDNPTLDFKPYGSYPPLYSFLFGLWSKAFGLGELQNTYFLLAIGLLRNAFMLWIALVFLSDKLQQSWVIASAILFAVTIPYHPGPDDRAESLSAFFFEAGLLGYALVREKRWQHFAVGLSIGLLGITMPFGVIAGTLLYASILYAGLKEQSIKEWLSALGWLCIGAIIPALPAAIYYLSHPEAFRLLIYHSTTAGGLGVAFKQAIAGNFKPIYDTIADYLTHGIFNIVTTAVGCAVTIVALVGLLSEKRDALAISIAVATVAIFTLTLLIAQVAYFAFNTFALAAAFFYVVAKRPACTMRTVVPAIAVLTLLTVFFVPRVARDVYARAHYAGESKKIDAVVRKIFEDHKDIRYAITGSGQYLLIRPFVPVFDAGFCDSLMRHLKQKHTVEVIYADSTDYVPEHFINKLLLRPATDIKARRISKVGEYLLVE
ncbi:MAG: ADP-ribosylglycohydrolase family protein [Chloroherpetonaceae bacterium]|nr:hypothetical protein [Chloroherpetonaceae bacterium]MCS7211239.1 hypothetical protein [Chloroherpetonaceae bacterium]MDW8020217.1 ADP-ribosylglycohydrolase family protein [Chloroherpetonaceae bacterium]